MKASFRVCLSPSVIMSRPLSHRFISCSFPSNFIKEILASSGNPLSTPATSFSLVFSVIKKSPSGSLTSSGLVRGIYPRFGTFLSL
jgi:hypothetical protein